MKILIFIFMISVFVSSCSPVRTTTMTKVKKEKEKPKMEKPENFGKTSRFGDTTYLALQDVKIQKKEDISKMFSDAVNNFKKGNYEQACPEFDLFASTFAPGDSLYYEAVFYDCECKILNNNIIDAKIILKELLNDKYITARVDQKVLVRLGQIECVSDNESKANEYFRILKEKYPDSKYIRLANCNSVE